ncbi:MAG: chromate transporter, partial [Betaproteobacteria bacterium]
VVGVILNLALFFGLQVFWPQGPEGGIDAKAAVIAAAAALALFRYRVGVLPLLGSCAVLGVLLKFAGAISAP